ncbi:MAG: ABC transporter substrate-binding protein [Chloroflexi bacterium]|nr:ABC transporter substrate-binding protein [Chloroflexota bacterium]
MSKRILMIAGLLMIVALTLAACGGAEPTPTPAPPEPTEAPAEATPTPEPPTPEPPTPTPVPPTPTPIPPTPTPVPRTGAWVDSLVFTVQEDADLAVSQLEGGDIDIYAYTVSDPELFKKVKENADLAYAESFGSYTELTFNPVGPEYGEGELNPFSSAKIREAVNWLIDRNYVVEEIYGGLAIPKFLPITSAFPDYARYVDKVRELEAKYAYDLDKAKAIIEEEMAAMGAEMVDGKWTYNGNPVTIKFVIRTEDERQEIGDYVSNQLEAVGFTVDRMYKNRTEASALWIRTDPAEGQWTMYTGGWITTAIDRDQGGNFSFFYTPRGIPVPLWQAYQPSEDFDQVSLRLENNDFATMEERGELFRQAMELALQDSVRVWINDQLAFSPYRADVSVTADLAGGIAGAQVYPYTVRRTNEEGGQVKIAQPGLLVEPWNPIAGSNWIYDTMPQRATGEFAVIADPFTGLSWPNRIEKAELVVKTGLPVAKTLDWIDLTFEDEIIVPDDAWVDWDAENQTFITAAEKFTETVTANTKSVVYYPEGMFDTVTWQDGSPLSLGDFIMGMILTFDRGKEASPIFDEAVVPDLESFLSHFKGVRIVSTDPLIIETYDDQYALDAENSISSWWPYYDQGQAPWHTLAVAYKAEENKELAFSSDKADALEVEWMSFIGGPSLEVLKKYLDEAAGEGFVPYAATLGEFVSADEAAARYENLSKFYDEFEHFWVNTGPFILKAAYPVEGSLELVRNEAYPDSANKWARFAEPKIAEAAVDGPGRVKIGEEAVFEIMVTYQDEAYPATEISEVKYLVFDAEGNLAASGSAELVEDGKYQVVLSSDVTGNLPAGSNRIEVAVSPLVVSIPSFADMEFVSVP